MTVKTIAAVLAKGDSGTELVAASSALWKFAWAANNASESPLDKSAFKASQQELAKFLTDNYKARIIKTTEKKLGAMGAKATRFARAIVQEDTKKLLQLVDTVKLSFEHIGVLAAIAAFYRLKK